MRVQPGRPIVPLQNCRRRLETPGPKDGCGGPRSQRRPYHRKWASRLEDPKRQRMAEKSSLPDEAKMHPPQASGKTREFDPLEVNFVCYLKYLIRGGERWIRTRDMHCRTAWSPWRSNGSGAIIGTALESLLATAATTAPGCYRRGFNRFLAETEHLCSMIPTQLVGCALANVARAPAGCADANRDALCDAFG